MNRKWIHRSCLWASDQSLLDSISRSLDHLYGFEIKERITKRYERERIKIEKLFTLGKGKRSKGQER